MKQVTIEQIAAQLRELPPEKLAVVSDFVPYLAERQEEARPIGTMLAAEAVLARDWNRPEEDDAWADL